MKHEEIKEPTLEETEQILNEIIEDFPKLLGVPKELLLGVPKKLMEL